MEEEKSFERKPVGEDMVKLIEFIQTKFLKEYGFKPSIIDTTNIIAKRVVERKLF